MTISAIEISQRSKIIEQVSKSSKKYELSDFQFIQNLASGSFGTVSLVKNDKFMFTPFTMKVISKKSIVKDAQITHILNEK